MLREEEEFEEEDEDEEEDELDVDDWEIIIVDEVAEAKLFAKRKHFAEYMVHPTLLLATSSDD